MLFKLPRAAPAFAAVCVLFAAAACQTGTSSASNEPELDPTSTDANQTYAGTVTGTGGTTGPTGAEPNPSGIPGGAQATDANVHFIGRFTDSAVTPSFEWSNSTVSAKFSGTGIAMTLQELNIQGTYLNSPGGNIYAVSVDGGNPNTVAASPNTTIYELATHLAAGEHTIDVTKLTEARVGGTRFLGFTVTGGQLVPSHRVVTRRLATIGDSITAGYGILGADANCVFSPATEDASKAYGAVAAKLAGAELTNTCWSARGVWRNEDGTSVGTLPQLYGRTLPSNATSTWNPNAWTPDAIVVNLGTNDFAGGVPPEATFEQTYQKFLASLRSSYPAAHIFCAIGPMLSDDSPPGQQHLTLARSYVQTVVGSMADDRVHFVEFTMQAGQQGCSGHPNVLAQQAMGEQLAGLLKSTLGW